MTPHADPADWRQRVAAARRSARAGDLLLLADEAPSEAERVEARQAATDLQHNRPASRRVIFFSGHRVDAPGRPQPRFPAAKVPVAAAAIDRAVASLGAGSADLAITQGACGGDLLFAEACLAHGVPLRLMQPLAEDAFVALSVLDCDGGPAWLGRYRAVRARLAEPPLAMPALLGPAPPGVDTMERCNRWMLHTALAEAGDALRFICLWDGGGGDGPGGTRHGVDEVRRRHGHVTWLDTRELFRD